MKQRSARVRYAKSWERWNAGNQPSFFPSYRDYWTRMDKVYRDVSGASTEN
jgi:hypothetical protein